MDSPRTFYEYIQSRIPKHDSNACEMGTFTFLSYPSLFAIQLLMAIVWPEGDIAPNRDGRTILDGRVSTKDIRRTIRSYMRGFADMRGVSNLCDIVPLVRIDDTLFFLKAIYSYFGCHVFDDAENRVFKRDDLSRDISTLSTNMRFVEKLYNNNFNIQIARLSCTSVDTWISVQFSLMNAMECVMLGNVSAYERFMLKWISDICPEVSNSLIEKRLKDSSISEVEQLWTDYAMRSKYAVERNGGQCVEGDEHGSGGNSVSSGTVCDPQENKNTEVLLKSIGWRYVPTKEVSAIDYDKLRPCFLSMEDFCDWVGTYERRRRGVDIDENISVGAESERERQLKILSTVAPPWIIKMCENKHDMVSKWCERYDIRSISDGEVHKSYKWLMTKRHHTESYQSHMPVTVSDCMAVMIYYDGLFKMISSHRNETKVHQTLYEC